MFVLFAQLLRTITRRTEVYLAFAACLSILVGAWLFAHFEHHSLWESLYWAITTGSTVGYGDVTPSNRAGQIIAVGVMIVCIPLFGALFSMLAARVAESRVRRLVGLEHVSIRRDHILILGNADETLTVINALQDVGHMVVVGTEIDPTVLPSSASYIKGDPRDVNVLAKARPTHARHAIITGARDGDILETAIALKEAAPDLPITVSTKSELASRALQALGVHRTLVWQELLGNTLAKSLQAPHAGRLLMQMVNSDEFVIEEMDVTEDMVGQTFGSVRHAHPEYILGLAQNDEVVLGIRRDPLIEAGSSLLVLRPKA